MARIQHTYKTTLIIMSSKNDTWRPYKTQKRILFASNVMVNYSNAVWCSYNERTNRLRAYRCLLPNHLHGKAAELCLANS